MVHRPRRGLETSILALKARGIIANKTGSNLHFFTFLREHSRIVRTPFEISEKV